MRQVASILFHNAGVDLAADGNGSVFQEFHEEKYTLSFRLNEWLCNFFKAEFTGTSRFTDEDFHLLREYQNPECSNQIVSVWADVPQPGMIDVEIHWSNEAYGKSVDWKEQITYCGSFSVKWKVDA